MEQIEDFKTIVANNLVFYRKKAQLTQLELAEKINYSDKAVSKWERGETVPDAYTLKILANIYGISVDDFLNKKTNKQRIPFSIKRAFENRHLLITCLSTALVWFIATVTFVILLLTNNQNFAYLSFIYAIPISAIICMIFSCIWSKSWVQAIFASILVWSILLCIFLTIQTSRIELIFIIGAPLQVLILLWFFLIKENKKIKWHFKKNKPEENNNEQVNIIVENKKNDD